MLDPGEERPRALDVAAGPDLAVRHSPHVRQHRPEGGARVAELTPREVPMEEKVHRSTNDSTKDST